MPKTIIITGASSGIGYALSQHLAQNGHNIIAVGRNEDALLELQKLYPDNIKVVTADITKEEDRQKIKDALPPSETGVYLVNNAGIAKPCLLEKITEEEWDQHYLVNAKAPLFLTKLLLPNIENGGRVLNISTGLAHQSLPGMSAYGVSKAALYMLKECFNTEFKDNDIAFGSAMPGVVDTPIQTHIREYDSDEFPAVNLFHGFKQHDELLKPVTAAKFLSWLLLEAPKEQFITGDWNIYDAAHQKYWAEPGEVKQRNVQSSSSRGSFTFFSAPSLITAGAIATAALVAGFLIKKL